MLIGALEAGDTKVACAVGKGNGTILERVSIPTIMPEEIVSKLIEYFQDKGIEALGVATLDPVDVRPESETRGHILDMSKLAWRHKDFLGRLKDELKVPMGLDVDVNGSCLEEATYGCARRLDGVICITIGTDVGVDVCISGALLHGMLHPEGGHILLTRHEDGPTGGICPYHKDCLEDFASGLSVEARWGKKVVELADRPEVWEIENYYIARVPMDHVAPLSLRKIILDSKVMHQEQLLPMIHQKVKEMLNGYVETRGLEDMDNCITPVGLHDDQGITGCIKLGLDTLWA